MQMALEAQSFRYEVYDNDLVSPQVYKERRARVLTSMTSKNIAIIFSADV